MNGVMIARTFVRTSNLFGYNTDSKHIFQALNKARFYSAGVTMKERIPFTSDFFFRQLFDEKSWTFSYILADINTSEAIIIDPGEFHNSTSIISSLHKKFM